MLPIAEFDPPFTSNFNMPHGLQYKHAAKLYGLSYAHIRSLDSLEQKISESVSTDGSMIIEIESDGAESHTTREAIQEAVTAEFSSKFGS